MGLIFKLRIELSRCGQEWLRLVSRLDFKRVRRCSIYGVHIKNCLALTFYTSISDSIYYKIAKLQRYTKLENIFKILFLNEGNK